MANWATQTATRECQLASNGELTVVERLASLLETGHFSDVTIQVGEGSNVVTFKAHRLLLATASQPLSCLVSSNSSNGPGGDNVTLRVKDVDPEAFQHVLQYIYTDNLKISSAAESLSLLRVSRRWGLPNLTKKTVSYLDTFLSDYEPSNEDRKNELCDLLVFCEQNNLELSAKCWKVLLKHVNAVVPCQGFLNMSKDMVRRLLNHPDFRFKNQLVLFEAIRDWGMNQVLQQNLSVNSLQGLIGEFLQQIDFKAIQDGDFMNTILPSECLGKADLIAFFMTRGMEIPRDLAYTNNQKTSSLPFEKTGRYKRGFKLSNQEIYKEHELRFRVDKKIRLLGVGFGFLFSNTDMGITVHCQGPWETRQWRDIIQTYCRVSFEKMKTADVRLMFSEPVSIEANQCYKILVRVGRMSAGSSDVELWGGTQGVSRLKTKRAEFCFLRSAIDPSKEVQDSDTENKPNMITDLFYELDDASAPSTPSTPSVLSPWHEKPFPSSPSSPVSSSTASIIARKGVLPSSPLSLSPASPAPPPNWPPESGGRTVPAPTGAAFQQKKKAEETGLSPGAPRAAAAAAATQALDKARPKSRYDVNPVEAVDPQIGSTSASSYSFRRNVPSARIENAPDSTAWQKKSHADEAASYYLTQQPSKIRGSDTLPFLRTRPATEARPTWQIPARPKATLVTPFAAYKAREASKDTSKDTSYTSKDYTRKDYTSKNYTPRDYGSNDTSSKDYTSKDYSSKDYSSRESGYPKRYSKQSDVFENSPLSKYGQGISHAKSRYESTRSSTAAAKASDEGDDKPAFKSRFLHATPAAKPETPRYESAASYAANATARYKTDSSSSASKAKRESVSPSRFAAKNAPSSSYSRFSRHSVAKDSARDAASKYPAATSLYSSRSFGHTDAYPSKDSTTATKFGSSSKFSSLSDNASKYAPSALSKSSSSVRFAGSRAPSTSRTEGGSTTSTSRYASNALDSSGSGSGTSRYGSSSNAATSSASSRYGSTTGAPGFLTSNRYGTSSSTGSSNISNSYSAPWTRFGSSIYRR